MSFCVCVRVCVRNIFVWLVSEQEVCSILCETHPWSWTCINNQTTCVSSQSSLVMCICVSFIFINLTNSNFYTWGEGASLLEIEGLHSGGSDVPVAPELNCQTWERRGLLGIVLAIHTIHIQIPMICLTIPLNRERLPYLEGSIGLGDWKKGQSSVMLWMRTKTTQKVKNWNTNSKD